MISLQLSRHWLNSNKPGCNSPTRCWKPKLHSGITVWSCGIPRCAGSWDWRTATQGHLAVSLPEDPRFKHPAWSENPYFDLLRQSYLITSHWAESLVDTAEDLEPHTRNKARFYLTQIINAIAPSNWVFTNPELLHETFASDGENLVRGMQLLAEDIERGSGHLKIRQTDATKFEIGKNLAITPGKVIFRNELMELIQYAPTTEKVLKRPLLVVPPWINKFYILDLSPEKSFVKWAVDQGQTVFMISWVNPTKELAHKSFEDYMRDGILEALGAVQQATGERAIHALGYCVGGTLLAATLAYLAATRDTRVQSATFLTTQVDFSQAGDLKDLHGRRTGRRHREGHGPARVSRRSQDGGCLQSVALQRSDLALRRRRLHEGSDAAAFGPAVLELGFDPHPRSQPPLLSAALLHQQ